MRYRLKIRLFVFPENIRFFTFDMEYEIRYSLVLVSRNIEKGEICGTLSNKKVHCIHSTTTTKTTTRLNTNEKLNRCVSLNNKNLLLNSNVLLMVQKSNQVENTSKLCYRIRDLLRFEKTIYESALWRFFSKSEWSDWELQKYAKIKSRLVVCMFIRERKTIDAKADVLTARTHIWLQFNSMKIDFFFHNRFSTSFSDILRPFSVYWDWINAAVKWYVLHY